MENKKEKASEYISEYVEAAAILGDQGGLSLGEFVYFDNKLRGLLADPEVTDKTRAVGDLFQEIFRFGISVGANLKDSRPFIDG